MTTRTHFTLDALTARLVERGFCTLGSDARDLMLPPGELAAATRADSAFAAARDAGGDVRLTALQLDVLRRVLEANTGSDVFGDAAEDALAMLVSLGLLAVRR